MARAIFNPISKGSVTDLPSPKKFNEELLGTDLFEKEFDSVWDTNDDYALVSGLANLKQAVYHRLITNPGELFAHPNYGCGLEEYVGAPINVQMKGDIARRIKEQLAQEQRIAKVTDIRITTGTVNVPVGTLRIDIGFIPIGGNAEQRLDFAINEQDWVNTPKNNYDTKYVDMREIFYPLQT